MHVLPPFRQSDRFVVLGKTDNQREGKEGFVQRQHCLQRCFAVAKPCWCLSPGRDFPCAEPLAFRTMEQAVLGHVARWREGSCTSHPFSTPPRFLGSSWSARAAGAWQEHRWPRVAAGPGALQSTLRRPGSRLLVIQASPQDLLTYFF